MPFHMHWGVRTSVPSAPINYLTNNWAGPLQTCNDHRLQTFNDCSAIHFRVLPKIGAGRATAATDFAIPWHGESSAGATAFSALRIDGVGLRATAAANFASPGVENRRRLRPLRSPTAAKVCVSVAQRIDGPGACALSVDQQRRRWCLRSGGAATSALAFLAHTRRVGVAGGTWSEGDGAPRPRA